jgi:hypothetical protein
MDHGVDHQTSSLSQHGGYGVIEDVDGVTDVVLRAMSHTPNARLREIMESFVRHLHSFVREVRLTESEYDIAIDFLNRIGKRTNDVHNEGILFADAVGFSTLVCLLNNGAHGAPQTAAALLGPFWRDTGHLLGEDAGLAEIHRLPRTTELMFFGMGLRKIRRKLSVPCPRRSASSRMVKPSA